jgi:uncharacterized protein (DUF1697 family)
MLTSRHIALLRGINVGRAKRIAMADLRQLIGKLGYTDVRTLLNSGNVVFNGTVESPELTARSMEEAIVLKLGVAATVIVLAAEELDAIIDANPLVPIAADPARLLTFIPSAALALDGLAPLCSQAWEPEAMALGPRAAYVWCPNGVLESQAAAAIGRLLGDGVTARNFKTLLRLQKLCRETAAPA